MSRISWPVRLSEAARWLAGELRGDDVEFTAVGTDSRQLPPEALFVALAGPNFDGHAFVAAARERGASAALVNRPIADPLPQLQVADTRLALGRLAAHWRQHGFGGPLIALTGSNGKTTLKEMIAAILRQRGSVLATEGNLNNDLGAPLTLLKLTDEYACAVIELGANHPGEIAYLTALAQPDVAIVNNAGPCHLEGFGDMAGVARAKGEIFQGLRPQGVAIINRDDPYADYWAGLNAGRSIIDFGLQHPAAVSGRIVDPTTHRFVLQVAGEHIEICLPLPGQHNVLNALAAAAATRAVGATLEQIQHGLEGLQGVGGRMQRLRGRQGSVVIHDAYNANPASLRAALQALSIDPQPKWLVLGDMRELGPAADELHAQSGQAAAAAGFERLYGFGEHAQAAVDAFAGHRQHFMEIEPLIAALLDELGRSDQPPVVLVKGSRGMRMERVVAALAADEFLANQEGHS